MKLRRVRGQLDVQAKKRKGKALMKRLRVRKEIDKPAITVNKVNGEYTVQMEVMKKFSNERLLSQYPYEDKPPLVFTVGRTDQENEKRRLKIERRERRVERRKNKFVQSEFRSLCEEICLKTYQEAIGVLPKPNPNDPLCPCFPDKPDCISLMADSCSCEECETSGSSTETDGDDWTIEFTPPIAKYDPNAKHPRNVVETESQYNYLDYKVKIPDYKGNAVPRYFTGLNGEQICSDLGGFYGPNGNWLEIGKDGYIGVDGRWVPMGFLGPDGSLINAEDGFFVDSNGRKFVIGVDGYVGKNNTWISYPPGPKTSNKIKPDTESVWTCLPKLSPSKVEFKPHGADRSTLQARLDERVRLTGSTDHKMPTGKVVPRIRADKMSKLGQSVVELKSSKSKPSTVGFKDVSDKLRGKGVGGDAARNTRSTLESSRKGPSAPAKVNKNEPVAAKRDKRSV